MKERFRAPLAAAVATLIGGGLAARGPDSLWDVWRFLFPYLLLFLAFEALRRRRRLLDEEAFLLGAAAGLFYDGVFAKTLQDGIFFLGVNWLSAIVACFDWGMITVVALHVADALMPRPAEAAPAPAAPELAALAAIPAGALVAYVYDALVGRTRFERMLGPAWLLADILFAAAAAILVRVASMRSDSEEPGEREPALWALGAFCAWLPGAQLAARAGGADLSLISCVYVAAWTALVGAWTWRLWRERGHADRDPIRLSRPILAVALWRLAGGVLVWLIFGTLESDGRGASAFAFFVDLPTRLVFLSLFFSSRLAI